jgi:hypothetical protein
VELTVGTEDSIKKDKNDEQFKQNSSSLGLKFKPKSLDELRIEKSERLTTIENIKHYSEGQKVLSAHLAALDFWFLLKKSQQIQEMIALGDKHSKSHIFSASVGKSDINKIMNSKLAWVRLKNEATELNQIRQSKLEQFKSLDPEFSEKDFLKDPFIDVLYIDNQLKNISDSEITVSSQFRASQLQNEQTRFAIEQARSQALINNFEIARTQHPNGESDLEFKVTLNLPFFASDSQQTAKVLSQISKIQTGSLATGSQQSGTKVLRVHVQSLIENYYSLSKFLTNPNFQKLFQSSDPQVTIENLTEMSKIKIETNDLEKQIIGSYFQLLFESGKMASGSNFLIKSDKVIK